MNTIKNFIGKLVFKLHYDLPCNIRCGKFCHFLKIFNEACKWNAIVTGSYVIIKNVINSWKVCLVVTIEQNCESNSCFLLKVWQLRKTLEFGNTKAVFFEVCPWPKKICDCIESLKVQPLLQVIIPVHRTIWNMSLLNQEKLTHVKLNKWLSISRQQFVLVNWIQNAELSENTKVKIRYDCKNMFVMQFYLQLKANSLNAWDNWSMRNFISVLDKLIISKNPLCNIISFSIKYSVFGQL